MSTPPPPLTALASTPPTRGRVPPRSRRELRRHCCHHLRQKLLTMRWRAAALEQVGELRELAVLECRHHGLVHIALAADRRRVGEVFRNHSYGFLHLTPPATFAG